MLSQWASGLPHKSANSWADNDSVGVLPVTDRCK